MTQDSGFDGSRRLSFATVRQELKKRNLSDLEIEMLFAKYDIDQNRELDAGELQAMFDDLEGKKMKLEKEIEKENKAEENNVGAGGGIKHMSPINLDLGKIEYILTTISNKIDSALAGKHSAVAAAVAND